VRTALRDLLRHPLRSALAVLGIAVSAAMLLDMVMLSGGIDRSFASLLLARGYQVRVSPRGTLPFDSEATLGGLADVLRRLRADPDVAAAGPVLGTAVFGRGAADSAVVLFGYGVEPGAQGMYELERGADLAPDDSLGVLLSAPSAVRLGAGVGDTVVLAARLDPQVASASVERRLVVRGEVRWVYDYRDQPSVGTLLPVMQALAGEGARDAASAILVRVRDGADLAAATARLRAAVPEAEVRNVDDLVAVFRQRLVYFRQVATILGAVSLIVTVLLVGTLLTITVNERLGEIATLRAIGIGTGRIVRGVVAEGALLTAAGGALGLALGLATARYLDAILTSFPGLPAAFSFFVARPDALLTAALVLAVTGTLAGAWPAWLAARAPIAATLRAEAT